MTLSEAVDRGGQDPEPCVAGDFIMMPSMSLYNPHLGTRWSPR